MVVVMSARVKTGSTSNSSNMAVIFLQTEIKAMEDANRKQYCPRTMLVVFNVIVQNGQMNYTPFFNLVTHSPKTYVASYQIVYLILTIPCLSIIKQVISDELRQMVQCSCVYKTKIQSYIQL